MNIYQQTEEYPREGLVQSVEILSDDPLKSELKMTTLEGKVLELEVGIYGIVLKETGKTYQSFEALLRENSKAYGAKFLELLSQSLLGMNNKNEK